MCEITRGARSGIRAGRGVRYSPPPFARRCPMKPPRISLSQVLLAFALVLASFTTALAQNGSPAAPRLVLQGYDPVAYFTEGKPTKGSSQLTYDWDEGRYYFASAGNRDLFVGDPDRYAPRFAGFCTASMT